MILTDTHRLEKERICLSSILFNADAQTYGMQEEIPDNLFSSPSHRRILDAFNYYASTATPPTIHLLIDKLQPKDETERKKLLRFFERLKEKYPPENSEQLKAHLQTLKLFTELNGLKSISDYINKNVETAMPKEIILQIEQSLYDLQEQFKSSESKTMTIKEGYDFVVQHAENLVKHPETSEFITTGYPEIDQAFTGGYAKKTYTIIAGRPSMGKTLFMLCSAVAAARRGAKVLFISIEMSLLQCYQRVVSMISGVESSRLLEPQYLTPQDWKKIHEHSGKILEMFENRLIIDEVSSLTVPQMERKIRYFKKASGVDIVFVDYVQIMSTHDGRTPDKESDYAQISAASRMTSKSLNIALVLGSQLKREVENRADKHPMLQDLRNSGTFEQDAARIIALYRDDFYYANSEKPGILEVMIIKNRFGRGGLAGVSVDLNYDFDRNLISGISHPLVA